MNLKPITAAGKLKAAFNPSGKSPVTNHFAQHLRQTRARARLAILIVGVVSLCILFTAIWQVKCCQCLRASGGSIEESEGKGRRAERRRFIYVYDLGPEYTDHVLQMKPPWYSHQYDVERIVTELLMESNAVRTSNPDQASLFFIPFFSARFTLAHFRDADNNMREAVEETSKKWVELLSTVRSQFPHFNRTNGRDHFGVLTMDHGRCHSLTFVDPEVVGEMFFVTYNGDKVVRSTHANKQRNMQAISYNYGQPVDPSIPDIPCYLPDRDIVVPVLVDRHLPLVSPHVGPRDITALFRFAAGQHHGVPISHHGHQIREELLQVYKDAGIPGWDFSVKSEWDTDEEWHRALFCICPPGHSQWTSRPFKSLLSGCIPVTFFREHDNPWASHLDYSQFSINIDPSRLHTLQPTLAAVLQSKAALAQLQHSVARVQAMFQWTDSFNSGAPALLLEELRIRASRMHRRQRDGDVAWSELSLQHTDHEGRIGGEGMGTLLLGQTKSSGQLQ